jgi:DNA-binding NarL/FixJ family response regulator
MDCVLTSPTGSRRRHCPANAGYSTQTKEMPMRAACNRYSILVVEDDALVSSYIAEVLITLEFAVIGRASSGPEAISLAEPDPPDLALVDIRLRGPMDGIEVAQLLLKRFGVPSIFLSGIGDDQTIERALTVSSLGFLQKPFLPSQVFEAIDRALTDILPRSR